MNAPEDASPTVAIVGTGQIGAVHVECARRAGATVVGLVGSSPDRARSKATAWGVPVVYSDLEELLEQPDIDVVHIASPNHVHASQAIAVANAGKHVICEKPMALDSASAGAMVDAAQAAGGVHATCFNFRFYPLMHEAHAMMLSGKLGEPRLLTGSYHQDWLFEDTDWNWRLDAERAGDLRSVADIGSHWLDLMSWISGRRVTEVCADLHTFIPVRYRPHGEVETFSGASAAGGEPVSIDTVGAAAPVRSCSKIPCTCPTRHDRWRSTPVVTSRGTPRRSPRSSRACTTTLLAVGPPLRRATPLLSTATTERASRTPSGRVPPRVRGPRFATDARFVRRSRLL